jgi:hypothetical protein
LYENIFGKDKSVHGGTTKAKKIKRLSGYYPGKLVCTVR